MSVEQVLNGETLGDGSVSSDTSVPAAITDPGCERELNEDRYAVIESASGLTWLVCDGMGGVAGGELAAQLALDAIKRDLENPQPKSPSDALRGAILEANRVIVLRRQNQSFAQMGTTVVAALFSPPEVVIAYAGDSRAYLVRGDSVRQLTTDHTYVQDLVNRGEIRPEDAMNHPDAHILTRCIGSEPGLQVDVSKHYLWNLQAGERQDVLVLCSDGLYSHVTDAEIGQIVSGQPPQQACVALVELAKSRGGYDNITIAVIPLGGSLRQEVPPGYRPDSGFGRSGKDGGRGNKRQNFGRDLFVLFTLGALAAVLTLLFFVLVVSK